MLFVRPRLARDNHLPYDPMRFRQVGEGDAYGHDPASGRGETLNESGGRFCLPREELR